MIKYIDNIAESVYVKPVHSLYKRFSPLILVIILFGNVHPVYCYKYCSAIPTEGYDDTIYIIKGAQGRVVITLPEFHHDLKQDKFYVVLVSNSLLQLVNINGEEAVVCVVIKLPRNALVRLNVSHYCGLYFLPPQFKWLFTYI